MSKFAVIDRFVDTMLEQKAQFEHIQGSVAQRETEVEADIRTLEEKERSYLSSLNGAENQDEEIVQLFRDYSQSVTGTIAEANQKIREGINGMTFIQNFEKHFTVAVFGKVKAGKSYIGNFVMGNAIKKTGFASAYDRLEPITVQVYDRGKSSTQSELSEQKEESDFATGMQETTSTIQWFDLGGMSWFDTPGIGSVTYENEELAEEYVKNADLVIFACNSDAAGTRQEFQEMRQLYDMGKPILLLLTQSDTYDYDLDDDGEEISILVPKSEKDREDTEAYMIQTLSEQGMSDLLRYDILTVSAKLALEALADGNEESFEKSNMDQFLERLIAITENDAAEMKKATPAKRFNAMLDGVIRDLAGIEAELDRVRQVVEKNRQELEDRKDSILEQVRSAVHLKMIQIIQDMKVKVERDKAAIKESEIENKINEAVSACIAQICRDEAIRSVGQMPDLKIQLKGIGDMQMRTDSIAYEHVEVKRVERDPKGLLEWVGSKVFQKTYYTHEQRTTTRYSVFDIGVNDSELAQNIMLKLDDAFRESIAQYIDRLVQGYYLPIAELEKNSAREIQRAIQKLEALRL